MKSKSLLFLIVCIALTQCSKPRDYLVVLDTSGSMKSRNTLDQVKKSVPKLLDNMKKGDSVTFMQFDEQVRVGETIAIKGDRDKAHILSEIQTLKAEGFYTDMAGMLLAVKDQAKKMKDEGKTAHIIVLSDGLDDPKAQRGLKRKTLDIGKYRTDEPDQLQDAFIYYISLGELDNPALAEQLKALSPKTQTYLAGQRTDGKETKDGKPVVGTPEQALEQVGSDVKRNDFMSFVKSYWLYALIALAVIALTLFLIWLIRFLSKGEALYGTLLYYPEGIQFPNKSTFTLNKIGKQALTIGAAQGNRLRIKDLGTSATFSFKGKKLGPNLCLKPLGKTGRNVQFVSQRQAGLISPGDRFRIGEYSFIFNDEEG